MNMTAGAAGLSNMNPQAPLAALGANGQASVGSVHSALSYSASSAQSVTGYPMQALDQRSCVVQVSNFPEKVNIIIIVYYLVF